jgi:hypothetical protein
MVPLKDALSPAPISRDTETTKTKTKRLETMKKNHLQSSMVLLASLAVVLCAGCASTPEANDAKVSGVFDQPVEQVQKAAVDALVVTGFKVNKEQSGYVEGFRPRKVGLFVGSGGETVGVWLMALGPDRTEVRVKTAKSFAGRAGQKNWDDEVLAELSKSLTAAAK